MSVSAEEGEACRNLLVAEIVERTGIDEAMIDRLVRSFYDRAQRDLLIGSIFARHVTDWEDHYARLRDFWSSVALMSGRYHGRPMAKHWPLGLGTAHFNRWLELFCATAQEVCPPAAAAFFIDRAHRIADSLEMGIATQRGEIIAPPPRPTHALLKETQ
jgi:hemoglobin